MPAQAPSPAAKTLSAPQKALIKLGLKRDIDLALHLPLRYEDETRIVKLRDAREGDTAQIEATVTACEITMRPRRQLLVTVDDGSDTCVMRFFSFYPSHQKALAVGNRIRARGEVKGGFMGLTMMHPTFKAAGGNLAEALTPVYSTVAGLAQAYLRRAVITGLNHADLSETLPSGVPWPDPRGAWSLRDALQFLHHPTPDVSLAALEDRSHPAWVRLKCEELLAQQLSQLTAKRERDLLRAPALKMKRGASHEILATQHFAKLVGWLEPLGVKVAWLIGSQKKKERSEMLALIESGEAALVVGTHAVIQEHVKFKNLALAVIDEQHRFGVAQRLALRGKMQAPGMEPHMLMMTATPIPRTLAMSYYADLDVSVIDELPPGRTPIVTRVVSDHRRHEVVERIGAQIQQGRQVYWVCPLIEESEALDLTNATETHADLSESLPGVMVGLLHSRMPVAEKKAVMELFTSGVMGVLVSTTVIEVGVDVPNASLMVIEHAERFGLSQLHQLRGRVGRGAAASACVLLYGTPEGGRLSETARERLRAMVETNDGFEIARRDLEIRGPGEFLGARQSGAPLLRFADLETDSHLLDWARALAPQMLDQHPQLAERHIGRWLGGKSEYLKA